MFKITLALTVALFACRPVLAQSVAPLMNYQGHLTGATGLPLASGQYTLTFNIYNQPTGGTAVWGPQAIVADVIDGYFNVVLNNDSDARSITTAFAAQPRYVSVKVGVATEILPRQQVLSAPYAIRAESASVAGSTLGATNSFPGTGNVGIGTTTPDRPLRVLGNARVDGDFHTGAAMTVDGSVTANSTIYAGGSIDVGDTQVRGNLTALGSIRFTGQKYCFFVGAGPNSAPFIVPNNWTAAHCQNATSVFNPGSIYRLACVFSSGVTSMGANNGGLPSPNCGW